MKRTKHEQPTTTADSNNSKNKKKRRQTAIWSKKKAKQTRAQQKMHLRSTIKASKKKWKGLYGSRTSSRSSTLDFKLYFLLLNTSLDWEPRICACESVKGGRVGG